MATHMAALVPLMIVFVVIAQTWARATATEALETTTAPDGEPEENVRFVRVRLGRSTQAASGELGQSITSYYMSLDIGTPPKPFKMLVDVNARENFVPHYLKLGVFYSRLNYRQGYCKKDSLTSEKEEAETLTINYQGCTLSGKAYTDRLELREIVESCKPRVVYKQRFLAMTAASSDRFARYAVDGVLAFNPWPISATGSELLTVGLARANLMSELKFGLHLVATNSTEQETGQVEDTQAGGGELTLGAVDRDKFVGALKYHRILPEEAPHAWQLPLAGVMFGRFSVTGHVDGASEATKSWHALLSTSSNGITGPARAINEILQLLGAQSSDSGLVAEGQSKLYAIECDMRLRAPELSFLIEDARYTIPASAYIKVKPATTFRKATCYLDLYSNYADNNKWELGTNFLSNFYTVFDINHRKVALGSLRREN